MHVGKDVPYGNSYLLLAGTYLVIHCGKQVDVTLLDWVYNCTPKYTARETFAYADQEMCIWMFSAALFVTENNWKLPKCLIAGE